MSGPSAGPLGSPSSTHPPRSEGGQPSPLAGTDSASLRSSIPRTVPVLSPRDEAILRDVSGLRLATADQLQRLHFAGPAASSQNARVARRCFRRLAASGHLWKAGRRVGGLYGGSGSTIYGLGSQGAKALGQPGRGRREPPSLTFLDHQLAVGDVFVRLSEAHRYGQLDDLTIATEPRCWRPIDDGSTGPLKPDLFVLLSTAREDLLAFIEVDNGTEHVAAINRKAELYRAHWQTGTEQREQGVYPLVIWLAEDRARQKQLRTWLGRNEQGWLHQVLAPDELLPHLVKGGIP